MRISRTSIFSIVGEIVEYIQSEGIWTYVTTENGADGYIPRRHCRILDTSEPTDVGYFSDHYRNDGIGAMNDRYRQKILSASALNLRQDYSPSSSVESRRIYSMSNINRGYLERQLYLGRSSSQSFSSTSSLSSSNQQQHTPPAQVITQEKGLYSNGTKNDHFKYDVRQRKQITRTLNNNPAKKKPVCGRKCGADCEHKTLRKNKQQQKSGQTPLDRHGLHKSSVVSVSSTGKSVSFKEKSIPSTHMQDKNNNNTTSSPEPPQDEREIQYDCVDGVPFVLPQTPCGHPELIIIQKYEQKSDTDISVERGDYAAIINDTKYDNWMYITNESGDRGFIPKKCAIKHECHGKLMSLTQ